MAHYQSFEDIPIWKTARELARRIYVITQTGAFARDSGLKSQVQRAAVSVISNIAEGFERRTDKEFCNFLGIAKASLGEIRAQFYLALDVKYISEATQKELDSDMKSLASQMAGFMTYLKGSGRPASPQSKVTQR